MLALQKKSRGVYRFHRNNSITNRLKRRNINLERAFTKKKRKKTNLEIGILESLPEDVSRGEEAFGNEHGVPRVPLLPG